MDAVEREGEPSGFPELVALGVGLGDEPVLLDPDFVLFLLA